VFGSKVLLESTHRVFIPTKDGKRNAHLWRNEANIREYESQYEIITGKVLQPEAYARFGLNFATQTWEAMSAWTSDMVDQMHIECLHSKDVANEILQSLPPIKIYFDSEKAIIRTWEGLRVLSSNDVFRNKRRRLGEASEDVISNMLHLLKPDNAVSFSANHEIFVL